MEYCTTRSGHIEEGLIERRVSFSVSFKNEHETSITSLTLIV